MLIICEEFDMLVLALVFIVWLLFVFVFVWFGCLRGGSCF